MAKGQFLTTLDTRDLPGDKWIVLNPLVYQTKRGERIEVPRGFVTDQTTFVPTSGDYDIAAVVHDWLYFLQDRKRRECDKIFREAMDAANVNFVVRYSFYAGVRLFGWLPWNKHRDAKAVAAALMAFLKES